jgi:hypothetical protein
MPEAKECRYSYSSDHPAAPSSASAHPLDARGCKVQEFPVQLEGARGLFPARRRLRTMSDVVGDAPNNGHVSEEAKPPLITRDRH